MTIPDSVTSIGSYAFYGCTNLTSVVIPNSVTNIGGYAFEDCSGLTSVTIPDSVTSIGFEAFKGCNGLTAVYIHDLAAWCGIEFGSSFSSAHHLYLDGEEVVDLTIPDSVTSIGSYAFHGCANLTSVAIPDSVTSIGSEAFYGCSGLTSVTIPDSVTSIGYYAFYGCSGLTSVTIRNSVTSIEAKAFYGCHGLTAVTIPACVCQSTMSNVFPAAYQQITDVTICEGVKTIGEQTFYNCRGLKSVAIPESVILVESNAFYNCSNLASVHIHDLVAWCNISFKDNPFPFHRLILDGVEVTELTIPQGVSNIRTHAFNNCYNLKSLDIPDYVTSIESRAFENCKGLVSCNIGKGLESIGEGPEGHAAFANAYTLTAFSVDPDNPNFKTENGALYTKDGKELVAFPAGCRGEFAVPNGVEKIWAGAFCGAFDLKLLILPDSLSEIGQGVLSGCTSLADVYIPARFKGNESFYSKPSKCTFHYERPLDRTLTLDGQGGVVETVTIHPTYCEAMPKVSVPTREGYRFGGYFSEPNGGGVQYYNAKGESCRTWDSLTVTTLYALWLDMDAVATPVIVPGDGAIFDGESCEVTITCATEGASIYYSTNGAAPRLTEAYRYAGPFSIADSTVVKAVAELDGVKSEYATASIRRMILTLADAAGAPDLAFTTGGAANWVPVGDLTSASGLAAQCGAIGLESETWLETTVSGAGSFAFDWKVDCERDDSGGATWDHLAVSIDGIEMARIDGTTGWATVTLALEGAGTHTVRWTFAKDDFDEAECRDLAWVSGVQWSPSGGGNDALPEAGDEATVASILTGAADGRLQERIGSVAEYGAFRAWVTAKGLDPQAVLASPHAWISYALGADRLFENEPTIQIGGVAIAMEVRVIVNDGEMEVLVDADKIAGLFEATGNPGDWNGTATLPAIAKPTGADGAEMRFKVLPGDGTSGAAFLRIAP